jgi:hypothetical protein
MSTLVELFKAYREGQEKYTYFLLTAAGAAIAFAVTQTQTATVSPAKIVLAFSVAIWGFSFFCGCRQILQNSNLLHQNYDLLRMQAGQHPEFPPHPQLVQVIQRSLEEQAKTSGRWGRRQFYLLIAGAVFYIAWHVLEMYLRSLNAS